jgi:hypothetical protein
MQGKMRMKNESKPERDAAIGRNYVLELIVSMADTTWRMFVPPAVLVPVGLWADLKWGTRPWLTMVGLIVGLGLSVMLVRAQMRDAQ